MKKLILIVLICAKILTNDFCGQNLQDKFLTEEIFKYKKNGTFVEIGAHNGICFSNTYYLEQNLGWRGICVEPQTDIFEQLEKNRSAICINSCAYKSTGSQIFLYLNGISNMLSGILADYDIRHIWRVLSETQSLGGYIELFNVPTISINEIFSKLENNIDLLCIDCEGCEKQILETIDFKNNNIRVIVVENNYDDPGIPNILNSFGYKLIKILGEDEIYIKI